jgi:hypothetical protein
VITVTDTANLAPSFSSQPVTTATADQPYNYSITATDPEGDDLLITVAEGTTLPTWLDLTDNQNGTATLTGNPDSGDVGSHSVVLQVDDGANTDMQSFTIIVSAVNQAPVLANIPDQPGTPSSGRCDDRRGNRRVLLDADGRWHIYFWRAG